MLDTWEIFGRLLTDDAFRKAIFTEPIFSKQYKVDGNKRKVVPGPEYARALVLVKQANGGMGDRPISLMALGELLVTRTVPKFSPAAEKLAASVAKTGINTVGRNFSFYVALGAIVIDDQLRGNLQGASSPYLVFDTFGFKDVQLQDRADLVRLFDSKANPNVGADSIEFCDAFWNPDCFLKIQFWSDHTHPVPNP